MAQMVLSPPPAKGIILPEEPPRRPVSPGGPQVKPKAIPVPHGADLSVALIDANRIPRGSRALEVFVSIVLHVVVIGTPLFLSLVFTDTINLNAYTQTFLVAPPPPPPPPPPPVAATVARPKILKRVFQNSGKLVAPTVIPRQIAIIKEEQLPPDAGEGVPGGVPGGVSGGQMGGVIGGIIGGMPSTALVPKPPADKKPIRVGGRIRAPRSLKRTEPFYPPLARQTKVQGDVVIDAILDEQGNVVNMKIVSGHPLLLQAALDAVRQWKYEPTYLNEQPISVELIVTVTFQLQ